MSLSEFSIKRPVTVVVVMLVFITIGAISILKLPLEMLPDTSFPGLMIQVYYSSSSPEEVERIITRPMEEILSTINNLKNINSTSSSSMSRIFIEFNTGTNMDLASMEIRDKVDQVKDRLPDDIERIRIRRWSTSDRPIINFSLSLPGEENNLYYWAENFIQPEVERIEGVANVDIRGIRNKILTIYVAPEQFYSSSIRITDLITTIRNNNINISAGYLEEKNKRFVLRVPGELKIVEDISNLPLNDKGLKIKDVAKVTYDYPERDDYNKLNGFNSLRFSVYRASTANVVDICKKVKETVRGLAKKEPRLKGMHVRFFRDQSKNILESLRDLSISGAIGGLLAILTLLFFLRKFRTTIIIAVAIPIAMVFTFSLMYLARSLFGSSITINIISLSGLMMAIGMLVDNSVVVLENIFRLRQEKGLSPIKAAITGSGEVALAVTASTLTTLVVFISIGFTSGSGFARFLGDFALTISLALIASLIVSLTFIPLASSKLLSGKAKEKAVWLIKFTSLYEKIVTLTLKNWKTKLFVVSLAALILFSAWTMITNIEREDMGGSEQREINVNIYMPKSFSLDQMKVLFSEYDELIKQNKKELAVNYYTTGYGIRNLRQGRFRGELELTMTETGPSVTEVKKRLKELLPKMAGITYEFGERRGRGGHSRGVRVELVGLDYTKLTELVPIVSEKLRALDEVEDVTSDLEGGNTQLLVEVDRKKAESSGVDSRRIAQTISSSISERPIGKFKTENKEIDIILKLQKEEGLTESDLKNLSIRSADRRIPLSALTTFKYKMGSSSIRKENKKSKLRIQLNTNVKGMMKISRKITEAMKTIEFPEGYSWSLGARWRRFRESESSSNMALILALIFIYIIMASLFESFVHPFTILITVPLALFGVAIIFSLTGITLNTTSNLGLLTLFGIVVNNGIILIDHIRTLRKQGFDKERAIIQAGMDRLRPIVMTAITTIFGVLPLALPFLLPEYFQAAGRRAQMWAPISVAILGGLTTSTFFTLLFLPTFYSIMDSITSFFKKISGFKQKL